MDQKQLTAMTQRVLSAWNTQDVERVVACYADDLLYKDPNTRGEVRGADAFRRYLKKLFENWVMTWALREVHLYGGEEGGNFLWHATLRKRDGKKTAEVDGMDLVLMRGDRILRNEVYFDRAVLAPLLSD